jgi:hypothetical protein
VVCSLFFVQRYTLSGRTPNFSCKFGLFARNFFSLQLISSIFTEVTRKKTAGFPFLCMDDCKAPIGSAKVKQQSIRL